MPEGPEARTVADKLRPRLFNATIIESYRGERAAGVGFNNLRCPTTITGVRSYGKKVLIDLDIQCSIIISLGMAGRVQYEKGKHSHFRFDISTKNYIIGNLKVFEPSFSIFFDDPRYMGSIDIIPFNGLSKYFEGIGPDLLQAALNEDTWISKELWLNIFTVKKLANRDICDVLTDQDYVAGIGWYLMTEILYYAGIHPERKMNTLNANDHERIRTASHEVIALSYSYFGFTIKDFISPDGKKGMYPSVVYGKTHDSLGNVILHKKYKGRTIHYVAEIQM